VVTLAWRDDRVTETGRSTFTGGPDDPQVSAAYEVDCGGLNRLG
jgi:hypothetical protein